MMYAIRTTSGREKAIITSIVSRINSVIMKRPSKGDIVEIIEGEKKGMKGLVKKIDKVNEKAEIELSNGENIIESLENIKLVEKRENPIKAILHTEDMKGYIFIEGDADEIQEAIRNIPHVRGMIKKEVSIQEIERFLIPEKEVIKIEEGDIVEIISGPFKGEKAKVTRVDEAKQEIVIELLDAVIPIPVTVSMNVARIYEKKKS
ncbi:MAG: transcription elongation factor Spt5 [Candidatus Aenigmatarchaeota archaeon]